MKILDLSLRGVRKKRLALILLAAALVFGGVAVSRWLPSSGIPGRTPEQRLAYLQSLGWEPHPECVREKKILLPEEFPEVLKTYNDIQLQQGFDLTKYAGKEIAMYTYELTNFPEDPHAECSLYVYRGKIIGGDVHSPSVNGFMRPLQSKENG